MLKPSGSYLYAFAVAVPAVVLASGIVLSLNPWLDMSNSPFLLFFGAVMFSSWYGGFRAGGIATVLSALICAYYVIRPSFSLAISFGDGIRTAIFVLEGILVSALFRDLRSAKHRLERSLGSLKVSEERFRAAIENLPDAFAIYDAERRVQYLNAQGSKVAGKTLAEVLNLRDEEIWPSEVTDAYLPLLFRSIETRSPQFDECNINLPTGNITLIVKYVPLLDQEGEIVQILALTSDITSRKKLENDLKEREARIQRLVDSNLLGVIFVDFDGRILEANHAFLEMVGYTEAEVLDGTLQWTTLTPPGYADLDAKVIAEIKQNGECIPFEKEYLHKDGSRVPILIGAALLSETQAQCICYVIDLTERKRTEAALKEANRRAITILESITNGFVSFDREWRYTYVNQAAEKMLNKPKAELIGQNVWELFPDSVGSHFYHGFHRAVAEQTTIYIEDFEPSIKFWTQVYAYPSPEGLSLFFEDVTPRKQAEIALRNSEERLQLAQKAAKAGSWDWDMLAQEIVWGEEYYLVFGLLPYSCEPSIENWLSCIHPEDRDRCNEFLKQSITQQLEIELEYRIIYPNGEIHWINSKGQTFYDEMGIPVRMIGIVQDISDRKSAEIQIRQFNETLEQRVKERTVQLELANQELEAFSYSVSHDLRAPIRHISGFVNLLQKQASADLDAASLRYLQIIQDTTKQAGVLVDDLLAFSRMGRTEMRFKITDMDMLVREVQREINARTNIHCIHWQIEQLPEVQGDPSMLRLVVRNLLENAVKYSQTCPCSEIAIGSIISEPEIVFFVRDNGVGFDMQYVHKLFGVFQRLHNDPQFEGTGIGLANVQRIIHRHGGRTWAEGKINNGATFFFSLPILEKVKDESHEL